MTIICDRYSHSGMVYSAAKENPRLSLSWARAPDDGLPRPDAVLFLDVDEAVARARGGWGGELYERAEMQRRVRWLFLALAGEEEGNEKKEEEEGSGTAGIRGFEEQKEDLTVVRAGGTVEEVANQVWALVRPLLEAIRRGEGGVAVGRVGGQ